MARPATRRAPGVVPADEAVGLVVLLYQKIFTSIRPTAEDDAPSQGGEKSSEPKGGSRDPPCRPSRGNIKGPYRTMRRECVISRRSRTPEPKLTAERWFLSV